MSRASLHDFASRVAARLTPIVGLDLASEVANNVASAFAFDPVAPVSTVVRIILESRLRSAAAYGALHLTPDMIEQAVAAVEDLPPPLMPNSSEKPRGFRWPRGRRVYHATLALDRVLSEGLKPRSMLGDDIHATGGGPSESVSFTLDRRIAEAIVIGLRALALAARGELQLGQMIIEGHRLAPKGTRSQLDSMRLSPDDVVRIDQGLVPVTAGEHAWLNRVRLDVLVAHLDQLVDPRLLYHHGASKPYAAQAWGSPQLVAEMGELSARDLGYYAANQRFEFYKYMLSFADWEHELYNPLFMHTSPRLLADIDIEQIGVVEAQLDADWLCAEPAAAQALGFDVSARSRVWLSDWANACEGRLRHGWQVRPPSDWEQPEREDTVMYVGSMAEVRVYDRSMITALKLESHLDDVLSSTSVEWFNKRGLEVETPIYYPYFKTRHPNLAGSR